MMPWDILRIILDYSPRKFFKFLRVNKQFYKLINDRKEGLTFSDNEISSRTFFNLLEKSKMVKTLAI
jgi:hypothetical protein